MANLISTGNQIGQGIAFVRLIAAVIIGCCFCLVGAAMFTSKPNDEKKNDPKQIGLVFISMGACAMLLGYLSYLFTKSFKGAGTIYTAYSAYDALTQNK